MGYLFLTFSLLSGAIKGFCGKKTSNYTSRLRDAVFASTLRMLLCFVIGLAIVIIGGEATSLSLEPSILLIALMSGASTAVFVLSWLISVRQSAYMMVDTFLMAGVMLPLIGSSILFGEHIGITEWIGLALLFVAVIIMCSYNGSLKGRLTLPSFLLLVLCGAANGVTDLSQKMFVEYTAGEVSASVFNFYTYLFASAVLLVIYAFVHFKHRGTERAPLKKSIFAYVFVMSVCLFTASYFKTQAAVLLPASQIYPLCQGGGMILSSVMAAVLFREKLTLKCIVGIALAFIALIFINVL